MNCMVRFNCCMGYQIGFSLLGFVQHANDVHPDHCGATHLCYIWCLLLYLILCLFTFPFTLMLKWCNGEMIPDGAAMMVRQFRCGKFVIKNLRVVVNFVVGENFVPQGVVLGDISRRSDFFPSLTFKSGHSRNTVESTPNKGKTIHFLRELKIWKIFQ